MRKSYRARQHSDQLVLLGPGVGTEAGTAIAYRLRLAFTAATPVDPVAILGMLHLGTGGAGQIMRAVGKELPDRLKETVLGLELDNHDLPMDRGQDEKEALAPLLIAGARYQVNYRTPIGFAYLRSAPQRRVADPGEVAEAASWLCSDRASFITGATLAVDGGRTAW